MRFFLFLLLLLPRFSMIFYIRNAFTLETFKNYQLISCVCFIFVGILHDHIHLFGSGLLFSEHLVTEQQTTMTIITYLASISKAMKKKETKIMIS